MEATIEADVLGRAIQNFQSRNPRQDRAWSMDCEQAGRASLILSLVEREEFVEHARHELAVELRRAVSSVSRDLARSAQIQRQG